MCTQWAIKMGLNTLANRLSTLANWTLAKRPATTKFNNVKPKDLDSWAKM